MWVLANSTAHEMRIGADTSFGRGSLLSIPVVSLLGTRNMTNRLLHRGTPEGEPPTATSLVAVPKDCSMVGELSLVSTSERELPLQFGTGANHVFL